MKYIVLIACLLVNYSVFVQAQITQVSDQDVELEGLFIEANREKLIGNFEKADSLYQLMLKRDRNNDAIYFELARVQLKLNKEQEAFKFIKKAIELEPTNEWYALFLAEIHEKMGDETQAAKVYETLTTTHPNDKSYYEKWAFHLVKANKVLDAVEVYNRLEKQTGISEELTRKKHLLYVGLGDNKKAAKELQALVDAYPKHLEYQYTLASFYQQVGETAKANLVFQNILKTNPNDTKAKLALQTPDGSQGLAVQLPFFSVKMYLLT
ncbi:MAG: tetratricopeptide repeat protein [Saprospiraceae bacterium]|nr:tetratricopeptide repeat protein [Saprospiraceae bacterium]